MLCEATLIGDIQYANIICLGGHQHVCNLHTTQQLSQTQQQLDTGANSLTDCPEAWPQLCTMLHAHCLLTGQ